MSTSEIEQPGGEREQAILRLKKRRDLKAHMVTYLVINAALWAVWAATGAGYAWPAWVTGGWAIGLLLNAWDVYFRSPITEVDVQREIERLRPSERAASAEGRSDDEPKSSSIRETAQTP